MDQIFLFHFLIGFGQISFWSKVQRIKEKKLTSTRDLENAPTYKGSIKFSFSQEENYFFPFPTSVKMYMSEDFPFANNDIMDSRVPN